MGSQPTLISAQVRWRDQSDTLSTCVSSLPPFPLPLSLFPLSLSRWPGRLLAVSPSHGAACGPVLRVRELDRGVVLEQFAGVTSECFWLRPSVSVCPPCDAELTLHVCGGQRSLSVHQRGCVCGRVSVNTPLTVLSPPSGVDWTPVKLLPYGSCGSTREPVESFPSGIDETPVNPLICLSTCCSHQRGCVCGRVSVNTPLTVLSTPSGVDWTPVKLLPDGSCGSTHEPVESFPLRIDKTPTNPLTCVSTLFPYERVCGDRRVPGNTCEPVSPNPLWIGGTPTNVLIPVALTAPENDCGGGGSGSHNLEIGPSSPGGVDGPNVIVVPTRSRERDFEIESSIRSRGGDTEIGPSSPSGGDVPSDSRSRLCGGGPVPSGEKIVKLVPLRREDRSISLRVEYPSEARSECPLCTKVTSKLGLGSEGVAYMNRHLKDVHDVDPKWSFKCSLCPAMPPSGTRQVIWMKEHLRSEHKFEAESGKQTVSTLTKVMTRLESVAPSLARIKPKPSVAPRTPTKSAPEQSGRVLTRSMTKASAEKEKQEPVRELRPTLGTISEEPVKSEVKTARRSLAPVTTPFSFENRRSSIGSKPVAPPVVAQPMVGRRMVTRPSYRAPVKKAAVIVTAPPEKTVTPVIPVKPVTPKVLEQPRKRRFNTWCLDHETSTKAWLDDEVIRFYFENLERQSDRYRLMDPCLWSMYLRNNSDVGYIVDLMSGTPHCLFPICDSDHWRLLIVNSATFWYVDPFGREPVGKVEEFLQELTERGRKRKRFAVPPPIQSDQVNCGVHVCLVAKSVVTSRFWYSNDNVKSFRKTLKRELLETDLELYSEDHNRILAFELDEEVIDEDEVKILEVVNRKESVKPSEPDQDSEPIGEVPSRRENEPVIIFEKTHKE